LRHLLVTNDFPPKVGGIQSYLWELWRRIPSESFEVLTTAYPRDRLFDEAQLFTVERVPSRVMLPTPDLVRRVRGAARRIDAGLVVLDPGLPLGLIGPRLGLPYAVVLHGAELVVPARVPGLAQMLARVIRGARLLIAGSAYPASEARRLTGSATPPVVVVPPGVDSERFRPLSPSERLESRRSLGLPEEGRLVTSVSRLVPRKGMDVLIDAVGDLSRRRSDLSLVIGGSGRDGPRLRARARWASAPVRMLGSVPIRDLPRLYGSADVFAMLCRNRWGGLEQEGFGIVFLEAAACGVPQVAGDSGGASEAVVSGETGTVVSRPRDRSEVAAALAELLDDARLRRSMGEASRKRATATFDYAVLAGDLYDAISEAGA
jgi:phosphatidyl-myo-inositol dimannoside synthase